MSFPPAQRRPEDIRTQKQTLRRTAREALRQFAATEALHRENQLLARLLYEDLCREQISLILAFIPQTGTSTPEPDIWPALQRYQRHQPRVRIAFPSYSGLQRLRFALWPKPLPLPSLTDEKTMQQYFKRSKEMMWEYNREEAVLQHYFFLPQKTAVLVPGLAFDLEGGRLGRGRGFYDRLLAGRPLETESVLVWGIGFSAQLYPRVPQEDFDCNVGRVLSAGFKKVNPPEAR